ncbi:MAG: PSD1 and planctomycete cytochrome C domain-containing protein [Planctomycetota bacterium]|nr:PSD1 and planctomycete cytochrome C domain-containing protein [Planctomycetota bacterium]
MSQVGAQEQVVDFARDVRPILSDRCFACHGPDEKARKAGLRLDLREGAFGRLRSGGRAIVAGDPEASELLLRIGHEDPEERMPPPEAGDPLTPAEQDVLRRWIAVGAPWEEHWAFQPVRRRAPRVSGAFAARERNWIDRFVFARLESEGLTPADEADPYTLVRRVHLDLTGLPPTPEEVDAFVGDERPDAYERLVDRLLASDRYGEHMARYWLDAARYGDTHGLHLDNYREMWPYRDHVIAAFRDNQPFDEFLVEALAGDLLPDATLAQKIATGFVRAHVSTAEGGSIVEEVYVRNVVDRVDTLGTVYLGLTVGCAACHDHKFDPITQRDYYQLFAFLNNEDGSPMDGNAKAHEPVVKVASAEQQQRAEELTSARNEAVAAVQAAVDAFEYAEPARVADERPRVDTLWFDDELPGAGGGQGFDWVDSPVHSGTRAMARRGEGLHQHFVEMAGQKLRVGDGDVLFAHVWVDPANPPREIMLQWFGDGAGWEHRAFWGEDVIAWGVPGTVSRHRVGDLPATGRYVRIAVPARDVGFLPGAVVDGMAFTLHGGRAVFDAAGIESAVPQEAEDIVWIDDALPAGANAQGDGPHWNFVGATDGGPTPHRGAVSLRRSMGGGLNQDYFNGAADPLVLAAGDRLYAHVWIDPENAPKGIQLQFHAGNWNHRARWGAPCHGAGAGNGADFVVSEVVPPAGGWVRLEVGIADVGLAPGAKLDGWAFTQVGGTVHWDDAGVRTWSQHDDRHLHSLAVWTRRAADDQSLPAPVREAASASAPTPAQQKLVRDHFIRHVHDGSRSVIAPLEQAVADVEKQQRDLDGQIPTTLVMRERMEPKEAFILRRGEYDQKGDKVERATPAFLPPMGSDLPRNRLGLARWLVSDDNPLTARVAVNRFWQQVFGTGLVKTAEDFGNQGEPPSHPALLDELALRYRESGWDVKALMRDLVLSATYRQSSAVGPEGYARDPENRLLARGPRHRLDAEVVRDQALLLSGLLVEQLGGPGVKPPQPEGLWKAVGYVGSNTANFSADRGPDKVHRRSIYTFWKRTAPPPQMAIFDAPSRESCRVRRERTNTPLQALLLLNDPQFVECARGMASRVLAQPGDVQARAEWALSVVLARPADPAEVAEVAALVDEQRAAFAADPDSARALIAIGDAPPDPALDPIDLAAWTVGANLLFNLDELVQKN